EVKGDILEGSKAENGMTAEDTVRIFIDTDVNSDTGYSINSIGADYMTEIQGKNGRPSASSLFLFDPEYRTSEIRSQNDWNAWNEIQKAQVATSCSRLEGQVPILNNNGHRQGQVLAYIQVTDGMGNEDCSDEVISTKPGLLIVTQKDISPEILTDDISEMLELELTAQGSDVEVNSITFSQEGSAELISLAMPIYIQQGTTEKYVIEIDTNPSKDSDFVSVKINSADDISVSNDIPVILYGSGASAYIRAPPAAINIDGAFGDWLNIEKHQDDLYEETANGNPNVDLREYCSINNNDKLSLYMKVDGTMMAGADIPVEQYKFGTSQNPVTQISGSTNGDRPLPNLPSKTGEDTIYIFLDTDQDNGTGYKPTSWFPIGADYTIEIKGQYCEIISSHYSQFNGFYQNDFKWNQFAPMNAECDKTQLETQIDLKTLGLDNENVDIYFHIMDWNRNVDYSSEFLHFAGVGNDAILVEEPQTRGITKGAVLNEVYPNDPTNTGEWFEVYNVDKDLTNWHVDILTEGQIFDWTSDPGTGYITADQGAGWDNSYTIEEGEILILYDGSNVEQDRVTIGSIAQTSTWSRYYDVADNYPYDTNSSSDWYEATITTKDAQNSQGIPEFETLLIPISISFIFIVIFKRKKRRIKGVKV
ncbi:MAG: hypothetical protein KAJ51_04760, partial [Thermoplasmata archaeon]|nr:hypothetical protein [Thermoplasmata archaeon]